MAINGSDLIDNPWNTTFSTFTDQLGSAFWLIPVSFIAAALYIRTRNTVLVSAYMIASGLLLAGGNIFMGAPEMMYVYIIFTVLGLVGLILGIFFIKK